jgi:hypothetical protein
MKINKEIAHFPVDYAIISDPFSNESTHFSCDMAMSKLVPP